MKEAHAFEFGFWACLRSSPVILELPQPFPDDYRRVELERRLAIYFLGRDLKASRDFYPRLRPIEKGVEAALVQDVRATLPCPFCAIGWK